MTAAGPLRLLLALSSRALPTTYRTACRPCTAVGIEMALRDGVDWLLHVDTDELIFPSGSPAYSLQARGSGGGWGSNGVEGRLVHQSATTLLSEPGASFFLLLPGASPALQRTHTAPSAAPPPYFFVQEVLSGVPGDVDTLVFPNYESLPERDDVRHPFLEVTLFKKNYAHVLSGAWVVVVCVGGGASEGYPATLPGSKGGLVRV